MNFLDILKVASENQGVASKELKKNGYSTAVGKPKRETTDRPKGVNASAVQAFLKKQENEEKQKLVEAKKKKAKLMTARAEQNTLGKMNNMIKRNHTKEAIFEVEGNDKVNGEKSGPSAADIDHDPTFTRLKCETDGKVRRALITNVKRAPVNPHFVPKEDREKQTEDSNTHTSHSSHSASKSSSSHHKKHSKDRHKSSSDKHRSHDRHKDNNRKKDHVSSKPEVKKKKRPPAPPPMSFNELLKIAEQKKETPAIKTEPKQKIPKKKALDRPLTQDEKDRIERVKSKEYQYWLKTGRRAPNSNVALPKSDSKSKCKNATSERSYNERGSSSASRDPTHSSRSSHSSSSSQSSNSPSFGTTNNVNRIRQHSNSPSLGTSNSSKTQRTSNSPSVGKSSNTKTNTQGSDKDRSRNSAFSNKKLKIRSEGQLVGDTTSKYTVSSSSQKGQSSSSQKSAHSSQSTRPQSARKIPTLKRPTAYSETNENVLVCGPTNDEKQQSTWDRVYGSMNKKRLKPDMLKKRRVIETDDEDEYDDDDGFIAEDDDDGDLDGFIDDSEAPDISNFIQQIFGYDKRKYKDEDDDCADMEASYSQIQREEKISAKLGLQEDLEDIRMEEEEAKRKAEMKKKNKKLKTR